MQIAWQIYNTDTMRIRRRSTRHIVAVNVDNHAHEVDTLCGLNVPPESDGIGHDPDDYTRDCGNCRRFWAIGYR